MGMPFGGLAEGVLLIALGLGYIVCYLARREEKNMQITGYLIGAFIIVLSIIFILNSLLLSARFCAKMGGNFKPYHMRQAPAQQTPQK